MCKSRDCLHTGLFKYFSKTTCAPVGLGAGWRTGCRHIELCPIMAQAAGLVAASLLGARPLWGKLVARYCARCRTPSLLPSPQPCCRPGQAMGTGLAQGSPLLASGPSRPASLGSLSPTEPTCAPRLPDPAAPAPGPAGALPPCWELTPQKWES